MSDDLVKQLQNPRPMSMFLTRADQAKDWTELLHTAADRISELEAKLAAIDDLMVRRIKHHQEMKDLGGSGMAMKREHYKLHVLSETLGEIRKVTKAHTTLAALKGQDDE